MPALLFEENLQPLLEMARYQDEHLRPGSYGATASFIGTMRDFNEGDDVQSMYLEHYPEMTQKHLEKIAEEAQQRWDIVDLLIIHRFCEVSPNDTIVVLAVWSAHREDAFQACRFLIEELKQRAPFWKKETLSQNNDTRWVEHPK